MMAASVGVTATDAGQPAKVPGFVSAGVDGNLMRRAMNIPDIRDCPTSKGDTVMTIKGTPHVVSGIGFLYLRRTSPLRSPPLRPLICSQSKSLPIAPPMPAHERPVACRPSIDPRASKAGNAAATVQLSNAGAGHRMVVYPQQTKIIPPSPARGQSPERRTTYPPPPGHKR